MPVRYAAQRDFVTRATDTPANELFIGTLMRPIRLDQGFSGDVGYSGLEVSWGEFELNNTEGTYDAELVVNSVDGQQVRMKVGKMVGRTVNAYSTFVHVATLYMEPWSEISLQTVRIPVRDRSFMLELPCQPQIFAGTGDLEGPVELTGRRRPWALGSVRNISPALVIPAELLYQVSWRTIEAITAVKDGGFGLSFQVDFPNVGALRAASIDPGFYGTCLADGYFRLGAAPAKVVTADVRGDNSDGYVTTTGDIVKLIAIGSGSLLIGDIDAPSFDALDVVQSATIGYYLPTGGEESVASAVRRLMTGIGGAAGFGRTGLFFVRRFEAPSSVPMAYYDQTHFVQFTREQLPASIEPRVKIWRVAYERNWTVMNESDLIEGYLETFPVDASKLLQPYSLVTTSQAVADAVQAAHPRAQIPAPVESFFDEVADANLEEERLRALYTTASRRLYRGRVKFRQFAHRPGDVVQVSFPRLLPTNPCIARIVEVRDDVASNETDLLFFL